MIAIWNRPIARHTVMDCSPLPAPLPRSRLPSRLIVQEQDHGPDLALGEEILPFGHRGIPRRALARQAGTAFRDPPEHSPDPGRAPNADRHESLGPAGHRFDR